MKDLELLVLRHEFEILRRRGRARRLPQTTALSSENVVASGHRYGAALALGRSAGYDPAGTTPFIPHLDNARAAVGEQAWQKARDEGATLELDAALRLALDR